MSGKFTLPSYTSPLSLIPIVFLSGMALVFTERTHVQFPLSEWHRFQPVGPRVRLVVQGTPFSMYLLVGSI